MNSQFLLQNYKEYNYSELQEWRGIYCLFNTINNKVYIGQSNKIRYRINQHFKSVDDLPIHRAIRKYGTINFKIFILEIFDEENRDQLNNSEIYFINKFQSNTKELGYNLTAGGDGHKGCPMKEEIKEKLRELQNKYTVAYNFRTKEWIEANSRQELCNKLINAGYSINVQNIYDAIGNNSYTKDFLIGDSVQEIQLKLATFVPPKKQEVFLYNYKTEEPIISFASTKEAEAYIKSKGYDISPGNVSTAINRDNLYVKDFLIATSESELLQKIESFSPVIYFYNIERQFIITFPTAAKAVNDLNNLGFKMNASSVGKAKLGYQKQAGGFIIGRTKKELMTRICNYTKNELDSVYKLIEENEFTNSEECRDWLDSINEISIRN